MLKALLATTVPAWATSAQARPQDNAQRQVRKTYPSTQRN